MPRPRRSRPVDLARLIEIIESEDADSLARTVTRWRTTAAKHAAADALRARGAALGRSNTGRTRRPPPHHALIQAAYQTARGTKPTWRAVLVQLERHGVTRDAEDQIDFGTGAIDLKTFQNLVSALRRSAREK